MNLSNSQFNVIVFGVALASMALVTRLRYCGEFELPGKPAKPIEQIASAQEVSKRVELSSDAYRGYLAKDSKAFGIPAASERQMSAAFPFQADRERRVLAPDETVDVLGMRLTMTVEKVKGSSKPQMMLSIENRGRKPLAYRIETRPSSGKGACARTRQVRHNALGLAAGGVVKRAECTYRKDRTLEIVRAEVIELPELGYLYLSSMDARNFGLDKRTSGLHEVPLEAMACRVPQGATLRNAVDSGKVTWRDQAEFYARHRCQTYSFPATFKAFQEDGAQSLPIGRSDL